MEQNKHILVVEDMEELRRLLRNLLQEDGFKVYECSDGLAGLHAAGQQPFHAVITDYRMPYMDGVDLTKYLRSKFPALTIIGVSQEDRSEDFLAAGANAFFLKPYHYRDILAMIGREENEPTATGTLRNLM